MDRVMQAKMPTKPSAHQLINSPTLKTLKNYQCSLKYILKNNGSFPQEFTSTLYYKSQNNEQKIMSTISGIISLDKYVKKQLIFFITYMTSKLGRVFP